MPRTTIDFGIDLGTTNSSIAVYKDGEVEIFKNNEGFEYTPSAVWLDKHDRLIVGRRAYENLESDEGNTCSEFKRWMGKADKKTFARSKRTMTPEELSAEVLKSLKEDVRQRYNEVVTTAVITVPADFDLTQTAATNRAAQLAGLTISPLLQEPVAAALAYGFQSQSDKVFWLVYDFGGGTFDAAVIQVRDGLIEVINHGGDNTLGGKNIDWEIVYQHLVPALVKEYHLVDFRRGQDKWRSAFAKLKWHAEEAKIALSRRDSFDIAIDFSKEDNFPEAVHFEVELQQAQVASLAETSILKTIEICRTTMADKRLISGNIEKILLVGGPTLAPYLRQHLADEVEGLGIPLETRFEPMTVVARGAAIFAGDQRLPCDFNPPPPGSDQFVVTFPDWKFTGSDIEPIVAGFVDPPQGQAVDGLSIEFVNSNARPAWRSGKLSLTNGRFMTTLSADKKRTNTYLVNLFDTSGESKQVVTNPDPLTYTIGLTFTEPPLTHTLGVGLANNEFLPIIDKGTPLPAHKKAPVLHTIVDVRKGQKSGLIRIPVYEGENKRADRNRRISTLTITPDQIRRDVPAGSDVEVTIDIDRSRILTAKAYIPILDEDYLDVISMQPEDKFDPKAFAQELTKEKERLAAIREKASNTGDETVEGSLQKLDHKKIIQQADAALEAASNDPDDALRCRNLLLDLRKELDTLEDALEWPAMVLEAEKLISAGKEVAQQQGTAEERHSLQAEEAQVRNAFQSRDPEVLRQRIESYRMVVIRILHRTGDLPVIVFQDLCKHRAEMRDQSQVDQLISEGLRAMNSNDPQRLQAINRQLADLLPAPIVPEDDEDGTLQR